MTSKKKNGYVLHALHLVDDEVVGNWEYTDYELLRSHLLEAGYSPQGVNEWEHRDGWQARVLIQVVSGHREAAAAMRKFVASVTDY